MRRHLRAVVGAAEHPDLGRRLAGRIGAHGRERVSLGQGRARHPRHHVANVAGKVRRALVGQRVERESRAPVRSRRAPEPQIDAARRDGLEHAELLGHLEGRVMWQHHAGAADTDALGDGGNGADQDLRRGADDGLVAVVLAHQKRS